MFAVAICWGDMAHRSSYVEIGRIPSPSGGADEKVRPWVPTAARSDPSALE
jgi:hypothetical protein